MDIWSKPTFVPRGRHLLFVFLHACSLYCIVGFLVCLFILLPVMSPTSCYTCHVYHAYLLYASFICSLHLFLPLLVCWFLVFTFAYTHMERGHMELGHGLPGANKKGWGCGHVDISQTVMFNRFRGLASPIWLCTLLNPLPPSLISLLDGLY